MRDALAHRGPDGAGIFIAPGVGLGSRRLSILDLSTRGHMPMISADNRFTLVYNGEIYNHKSLRHDLAADGVVFRGDSDTEVLLRLYERYGLDMLERLNGMFAFALWDNRNQTLLLCRDRLGIKPLFYHVDRGVLRFASEIKALTAGGVVPSFDHSTWEELLCFRYVAGERTPHAGVRRLLPGHYLTWRRGSIDIKRWWNLADRAQSAPEPSGPASAWFESTFDDSIRLHRISDVPLGVMLSGGLDSGSIAAAVAKDAGAGVHSFTMGFGSEGYSEERLARMVADKWRLEQHLLSLPHAGTLDSLRQATRLNDEPLAHASDVHVHAIARAAHSEVKVLLSGEGADELLGGYRRYNLLRFHQLWSTLRLLPRRARDRVPSRRAHKIMGFADLGSVERMILYNACDTLPADLQALGIATGTEFEYRTRVLEEAAAFAPHDYLRQAMYLDQHTFLCSLLDRNDRMTMGASIECRVPFLDHRLVEGLAATPSDVLFRGRRAKSILRDAVGHRLPSEVLRARKWGFGVPWNSMFRTRGDLREYMLSLPKHRLITSGPFDRVRLQNAINNFVGGDDQHASTLVQLAMITIWSDTCLEIAE